MNLTAQNRVTGSNGEPVGVVTGIAVDYSTNQVCDLIVSASDRSITMAIPVLSVVKTDEDEVLLSIPAERCRDLATASVDTPAAIWATAATRAKVHVRLAFGCLVLCADGPVGQLRRVIYDQYSCDILELVVGGMDLPHEVAVPVEWAGLLAEDRIVLSCQRQDLQTMPEAPEDG